MSLLIFRPHYKNKNKTKNKPNPIFVIVSTMDRTEWWDRYRHDIKYPTRSIIDKNIINKTSKDLWKKLFLVVKLRFKKDLVYCA
jgi:hypothetical protein